MGEIETALLVSGQTTYCFVPPHGWGISLDSQSRRVILADPDRTASITFAFSGDSTTAVDTSVEACRERVWRRFTEARIAAEFPCYTSTFSGREFEVAWLAAGQVAMRSRIAFFSTGNGLLEVSLSTMENRFATFKPGFGALLTSFQRQTPAVRSAWTAQR